MVMCGPTRPAPGLPVSRRRTAKEAPLDRRRAPWRGRRSRNQGVKSPLWVVVRARRRLPFIAGWRDHRRDWTRWGRQVDAARRHRGRETHSAGRRVGARRRFARSASTRGRSAADRLHAAGVGAQPVPNIIGIREHRLLRPPVRAWARERDARIHRLLRATGLAPLSRSARGETVGRHETETRSVLRPGA